MKVAIDKKELLRKNPKARASFKKNAAIMEDISVQKSKYTLGQPYGLRIMHPIKDQSEWEGQPTVTNFVRLHDDL